MDNSEMFDAIAAHRLALAGQLEELTPEQWDAPSLCAGWRVREVLAHLVTLQEIPTWRFIVGTVGMSGFNRKVDRFAREWGRRPPSELLEIYRRVATSRKTPPIVGPIAPLSDVVIHSLDVQRPLGLPAVHSDASLATVLGALSTGLPGFVPRSIVRGLRFEATDLDWSQGQGALARGPAGDLLLTVTGRTGFEAHLTGEGAALLRSRTGADPTGGRVQ